MDRRKIEKFKAENEAHSGDIAENMRIHQIVNSKKVNEALLDQTEELFELEFTLKQKAQLKYLQVKSTKFQTRFKILNMLSHEFLWAPTPVYYVMTSFMYFLLKNKFRLTLMHAIPFLAIPPTMDYYKRDHYVSQFPEDKKALSKSTEVVN